MLWMERRRAVTLGSSTAGALVADPSTAVASSRYAFVTPDACHDKHDCSISTGDAWLKAWSKILGSPVRRRILNQPSSLSSACRSVFPVDVLGSAERNSNDSGIM
jgi:hypothetical protein